MQNNPALYLCWHYTHTSDFQPLWLVINTGTKPPWGGWAFSKDYELAPWYLPACPKPCLINGATKRLNFFLLTPIPFLSLVYSASMGLDTWTRVLKRPSYHKFSVPVNTLWSSYTGNTLITKGKYDHPKQKHNFTDVYKRYKWWNERKITVDLFMLRLNQKGLSPFS